MTMLLADPILAKSRGDAQTAIAYAQAHGALRLDAVKDYINRIYEKAPQAGIDAAIAVSQAAHETGDFSSSWWNNRLNPAGLGITGDTTQNNASHTWTNGKDAADSHLAHLLMYTKGDIGGVFSSSADPRYQDYIDAHGHQAIAHTINDLAGTWGVDPNYANALVAKGNSIFPKLPASSTGGTTVPVPILEDHIYSQPKWFANRYDADAGVQGSPKVIFLHIQQGSTQGSWDEIENTDRTASETVFANRDGTLWLNVPEQHGPWTNGDVQSPTALGQEILSWGGNPNIWTLSIETEGFSYTPNVYDWNSWPKPQAQLDAIVNLIQYWMQKYGIPAHHVLRHADVNMVTRSDCPGDDFFNYIHGRIQGTVVNPPSQTYVRAVPVVDKSGKTWDGTFDATTTNGSVFHGDVRVVTVIPTGTAIARQWASVNTLPTRDPIPANTKVHVIGWVNGEAVGDEERWWLTPRFSRIHVSGTVEKPAATVPAQAPDDPPMPDNSGPKIINGHRFYPVGSNGKGRTVTAGKDGANLYKNATPKSALVRKAAAGEKLAAKYWVHGHPMPEGSSKPEDIWWTIDSVNGPRVSILETNEKPL